MDVEDVYREMREIFEEKLTIMCSFCKYVYIVTLLLKNIQKYFVYEFLIITLSIDQISAHQSKSLDGKSN